MNSLITVITPTIRRPLGVVQRCLDSVNDQTMGDWLHFICSDGEFEIGVRNLCDGPQRIYFFTGEKRGHFGAGVRQFVLEHAKTPFVAFLDDDNILFPRYCDVAISAIDRNGVDFAVAPILHFGPFPNPGHTPRILTGLPMIPGCIDTLQVICRTEVMKKCGWVMNGYVSDGSTYERLASMAKGVRLDEVLAAHL